MSAWRFSVGTGRMDLALRRDYQESLALVQREIGFRHIRGHGLFSDGMGVYQPYRFGEHDRPRHSFTYLDQVVDAYLELGIRPFLELGFMPSALASGERTVFWWRGNVTPPRSYRAWAGLVRATVTHLVERYGLDEVRGWPIEVWNEPNLPQFWQGADAGAYHRLYEYSANAVKEVDAELRVGGPAISPGSDEWLDSFADFVVSRNVPIDFVSRHAYADSYSNWTFSDVFEEEGVPTTPFHGGFGLLTHRQIKKPTFHLYAFLERMGDRFLSRGDDHLMTTDASGRITVLAWAPVDHVDLRNSSARHTVRLSLPGDGREAFLLRSSADEERGNAWAAWQRMGQPPAPLPRQLDELRECAEPGREHARIRLTGEREITLARHEVTLLEITPIVDATPPWWDESRLLGARA